MGMLLNEHVQNHKSQVQYLVSISQDVCKPHGGQFASLTGFIQDYIIDMLYIPTGGGLFHGMTASNGNCAGFSKLLRRLACGIAA